MSRAVEVDAYPWTLNLTIAMGEELHQKILSVLEGIRPCLKIDGGDIEVADLSDDGFVRLRFLGACSTCPLSLDDFESWSRADSDVGPP